MLLHDQKALFPGFLLLLCRKTSFQETGNVALCIGDLSVAGGFHATDTPVNIGTNRPVKIVFRGNRPPDNKRLMTNQHSIAETFPVQLLRRPQAAVANHVTFGIRSEEHTSELQSLM